MESPGSKLKFYIAILAMVVTLGVIGFSLLEGFSPFDSLYLTIITISTVGYGDITAKTLGGRVLEMFIIIAGVGSFVIVIANFIEITIGRKDGLAKQKKINMVIGVFFSEVGVPLIRTLNAAVEHRREVYTPLLVRDQWSEYEFEKARKQLASQAIEIDLRRLDLPGIHALLLLKRSLLVQLLQHPALFEHESFTDLLNAVFHLEEELAAREGIEGLPQSDYEHLAGDARRVLSLILDQWLTYMAHLKVHYPYLYSLAIRTNPFYYESSPVVR